MRTVDFLIVGAQKSGTTSLYEYLSRHPAIFMPFLKEIEYFSSDKNYAKGLVFYNSFFEDAASTDILGEASPQYMYDSATAERIFKYSPKMKLIMCLRDPADRAYSHYRMNKRRNIESRAFEVVVEEQIKSFRERGYCHRNPEFDYLGLGLYGEKIKAFSGFFGLNQIKVVWTQDLEQKRKTTVDDILDFLGISSGIEETIVKNSYHIGGDLRFPWIYATFQMLTKVPGPIKAAIKRVIGADRVGGALHRIETQFFVSARPDTLQPEIRCKLQQFYENDSKFISSLLGVKPPW